MDNSGHNTTYDNILREEASLNHCVAIQGLRNALVQRTLLVISYIIVLSLTLANQSARAQDTAASLKSKSLRIVNTYTTSGLVGRAVLGPDSYIWLGASNGTLRRLDPLSNRIVSEKKLGGGIDSCIKTFSTGEKRLVVVGSRGGLYCFDEDVREVAFFRKEIGASLYQAPVVDGNGLLILAENGLVYRLDQKCKLQKIVDGKFPGTPTSAPALLRQPHPLLVYGTAVIGDFITQEDLYQITLATPNSEPNSEPYRRQDVSTTHPGKQTLGSGTDNTERVVAITAYEGQQSDIGLALTANGKVFKVDHNGLKKDPLIDLKCSPITELILMSDGRIALIANDLLSERPLRCLFSITGKLISRTPLQDLSGNTVEKVERSPTLKATAIFTDNGRLNALIGFSNSSNSCLRLIDVQTGLVLATLSLPHEIDSLSHLQGTDFFVSGVTSTYPDEVSKHCLVRVVSGQ